MEEWWPSGKICSLKSQNQKRKQLREPGGKVTAGPNCALEGSLNRSPAAATPPAGPKADLAFLSHCRL